VRLHAEPLPDITIANYERLRQVLDFEPAYQREGGVWSSETRARLIDSILNGFDVPKLYFERATVRRRTGTGRAVQYAVLDGKQRLESIGEFLDGQLRLPKDFRFYQDEDVKAADLDIAELKTRYPQLVQRLLDFKLPIVNIQSDSVDLVEEMFQRLNASTALNHAERRNAISGPTRDAANDLANHPLLTERSPIKSARYKYRELAAKFLAIEHQESEYGRIVDTKAATLLNLFLDSRGQPAKITAAQMAEYQAAATGTLDRMMSVFEEGDPLLGSIGTLVVYYITFRNARDVSAITRDGLMRFEAVRRTASRMSEDDPDYARPANIRLREYNTFVQSSNDGRALSRRSQILGTFAGHESTIEAMVDLDGMSDAEEPSSEVSGE
jgi:hypothetical protein